MVVGIIDYGLGNLRSVAGAVERLGHEPRISSEPEVLAQAAKLILPGVGAFGDGMRNLHALGLSGPITEMVVHERRPVIGICLGAQLMARSSLEFGRHEGLGWIDAEVEPIRPTDQALRVPHVGWNAVRQVREDVLFDDVPGDALFYFVHSFHIRCSDPTIVKGECDYGQPLTAVLRQDNIVGTQFHPEKSQRHGLRLLENFLNI